MEINQDNVNTNLVPKTLIELRQEYEAAKDNLNKHPTHYAALSVQNTKRAYEHAIQEARDVFFTIDGGSGFHTLTPLEITTSALKELASRCKALEAQFGYIDFGDPQYKPFRFLGTVANRALEDIGE